MITHILLCTLTFISCVYGRGSGVPVSDSVCTSMEPGHRTQSQALNTSPYKLHVNKECYGSGEDVTVTIVSKMTDCVPLEGLFLQAKKVNQDDANFGTWTTGNTNSYHLVDCFNRQRSGVSHSKHNHDKEVSFVWKAPSSNSGDIEIVATLLKDMRTYWTGIKSSTLRYDANCRGRPSPTPLPENGCVPDTGNEDNSHSHEEENNHGSSHENTGSTEGTTKGQGDENDAVNNQPLIWILVGVFVAVVLSVWL